METLTRFLLTAIQFGARAWVRMGRNRKQGTRCQANRRSKPTKHLPREERFQGLGPGGFHQIAYTEWGHPKNPHVVVCVHGMTRNSRDFDFLAADLAADFRVVCMDVVGRGRSDWLIDKRDYGFSLYLSDSAALLARISAPSRRKPDNGSARAIDCDASPRIDWVGTSMGGLMGMMLAAKTNSPIRRLVLNDVGPMIPWSALLALSGRHTNSETRFENIVQVEEHLRESCADFGPLTDSQWRHLASHHTRTTQEGGLVLTFDPALIGALTRNPQPEFELGGDCFHGLSLWSVWDKVRCPSLVLRGALSNMLLATTAREMQRRHPRTTVVEFLGIGHAPWVAAKDQIEVVREFLQRPDTNQEPDAHDQQAANPFYTRSQS